MLGEGFIMLIRVVKRNNKFDMIKEYLLEEHIQAGEIIKFHRSSGWVTVGRDPIRGMSRVNYIGPERRLF
jgi:hypothetical protein